VATDGSYASAGDPRVLFGLGPAGGEAPEPTALHVLWPDGSAEAFDAPPAGAYTEIVRGSGRPLESGRSGDGP
jgi:hypothetical protein